MIEETKILKSSITEDSKLLEMMVRDSSSVESIYLPGPYWRTKTKSAVKEIRQYGLSDFRGYTNGIATSFGDNAYIDKRHGNRAGIRSIVLKICSDFFPFNRVYDAQVRLTKNYYDEMVRLRSEYLIQHPRVKSLLNQYEIGMETVRGGCRNFITVNGKNISHHYLQLLDTIDHVNQSVKFSKHTRFLEIGVGFGANTHLLVELFDVRKIICVDIVPNLYVSTQYLKSFYGSGVIDYLGCKSKEIKFKDNDDLEIFCIAPQQIENIRSEIDVFHNAHSFVEMPKNVVENYANKVNRLLPSGSKSFVSLVSYDQFDLATTFHPDLLTKYFKGSVSRKQLATLDPDRINYHYIISN